MNELIYIYFYFRSDIINSFTYKQLEQEILSIKRDYNSNDSYQLCNKLNILIQSNDLGTVKGILQSYKGEIIIHLNKNLKHKKVFLTYALGYFFLKNITSNITLLKEVNSNEVILFTAIFLNQSKEDITNILKSNQAFFF